MKAAGRWLTATGAIGLHAVIRTAPSRASDIKAFRLTALLCTKYKLGVPPDVPARAQKRIWNASRTANCSASSLKVTVATTGR